MRIGIVTGEYPPDQGGVGDFTRELGVALLALGHEVHVLTDTSHPAPSLVTAGVAIHPSIPHWKWGCWRQILALSSALSLDVLNVQYQAAAYAMHPAINWVPRASNRPPVFVTFHDLKVPYLFPKAGPLRWRAVLALAHRADGTIVTNREDYLTLEGQLPSKRLNLIPIGSNIPLVPPAGYDRNVERARWGVGPNDLLLGYFGFLNESKGGEELIRSLALLVERGLPAHLLMVGGRVGTSDPTNRAYADRVNGLIADLGLESRVHWTHYASPVKVSAGLLATDVCVLPYRDGVSFRRGTLHACLIHGRAVVTTRPVVPLQEVRAGQNMLLVSPHSPEDLADAVARVAADPALRARLEAGSSALAAEFTWERIARQTAALFGRTVVAE
ncbi:MAG: glycosyltransferase family 4 protein [Anaerolineae bacterium]|nr:glycosyltransferase family 4 protein [Anaerolineae bacterium]